MRSIFEHSAINRMLDKEVKDSLLIHSLDNLDNITTVGEGTVEITDEKLFEGNRTLKLHNPCEKEDPTLTDIGQPICSRIRVHLDGKNLEKYDRLSFWIYPVKNGFSINFDGCIEMLNEGENVYPRAKTEGYMEGVHSFRLDANKWNHVIWEFPEFFRDNITLIQINFQGGGLQPGMEPYTDFYLSNLKVETVGADKYYGWDTDGKIAFCHSGYFANAEKKACCSLEGDTFKILDANTNECVLTGNAEKKNTDKGDFYLLDFSTLTNEGEYIIEYAGVKTLPFKISESHWDSAIDKLRSFFKSERCGDYLEGVHAPCHQNVFIKHPKTEEKIPACGGWHDAADLSQGLCNTAEGVHTFLNLADSIEKRNPDLAASLREEAFWGAQWVLKTRFGDGYRCVWHGFSRWTSGKLGERTDECALTIAENDKPFEAFCAIAAEVAMYKSFKETHPDFAEYALKSAIEDFSFTPENLIDYANSSVVAVQMFAEGCFAASALYEVTGEEKYIEKAIEYADYVLSCQQTEKPNWDIPIRGFFYEDAKKQTPVVYDHRGHEQIMVMALIELLKLKPEHSKAPLWKNALELYKEFILKINEFSLPYGLLPAGIYSSEYPCSLTGSGDHKKVYFTDNHAKKQFANGIRLSDTTVLRRMPMQRTFCGHFGVVLSRAKAVSALGKFLNDKELISIANKQLEWIVGCNPFARSYIYGEGYDFQYMSCWFSRDTVGAIPVGIKAYEDEDVPSMPSTVHATYYEVWVHPASRFLWTLSDLI